MGSKIHDPNGLEGPASSVDGLGLLDIETVMNAHKTVRETTAQTKDGISATGYEIHIGSTHGRDTEIAWLTVNENRVISAASPNGQIQGTYLHGLFGDDTFRNDYLGKFNMRATAQYDYAVDETLNEMAAQLEEQWDLDALLELATIQD